MGQLKATKLVALLCVTVLTAVLSVGADSSGATPADDLQGTWLLQYYGESGNLTAPYPERDITLTFSSSNINGHAGVNPYSGWRKIAGDELTTYFSSTELAGPEHLMKQEDRYLSILASAQTCKITNSELATSSGEETLIFTRAAAYTTVFAGNYLPPECDVGDWRDIVQVAAGDSHTVGLKSDGTVVAVGTSWVREEGERAQYEVGDWMDIVQVAAGGLHTVGLKSDDAVIAVGYNYDGQCEIGDWANIVQVDAGGSHTVGLKSDGTVVAVGSNTFGQCDVRGWADIDQVAAGTSHTVGLKSDGTVVAVGHHDWGQCDVGDWTDIDQVAAGTSHTVGLKSGGTVVAVGGYVPELLPTPCFIATAAYGTPMAEEIQVLREFRDGYLLTNPLGQGIVDLYYTVSPPIAEFITEHPILKPVVRVGLLTAVAMSTVAVNTAPAAKAAIEGFLVLVLAAVTIWATRRRRRGTEYG